MALTVLITKKYKATTVRVPGVRVVEDLLDRDFAAERRTAAGSLISPTCAPWEGWLYLVAVQDLYSRRIVGWSMADHMRTESPDRAGQTGSFERSGAHAAWLGRTDKRSP